MSVKIVIKEPKKKDVGYKGECVMGVMVRYLPGDSVGNSYVSPEFFCAVEEKNKDAIFAAHLFLLTELLDGEFHKKAPPEFAEAAKTMKGIINKVLNLDHPIREDH